ncbi:hypothetical protein [Leptolyngbya ohadii]|uniref:hypothetical protein n=1 Tax=Leptolyngbya ohadii TaxID=1962290 RepID=UPI0015C5A19E|nr:hypothetical protein [Leptolyngbya ohadii]
MLLSEFRDDRYIKNNIKRRLLALTLQNRSVAGAFLRKVQQESQNILARSGDRKLGNK